MHKGKGHFIYNNIPQVVSRSVSDLVLMPFEQHYQDKTTLRCAG